MQHLNESQSPNLEHWVLRTVASCTPYPQSDNPFEFDGSPVSRPSFIRFVLSDKWPNVPVDTLERSVQTTPLCPQPDPVQLAHVTLCNLMFEFDSNLVLDRL